MMLQSVDLTGVTSLSQVKRFEVDLFVNWIKQHWRIKAFYGTSESAVKTQIWTAISIYVLVAILKKRLGIEHSLYTILQILSVTVFEKMPVVAALSAAADTFTDGDISKPVAALRLLTGHYCFHPMIAGLPNVR